MLFNYRWKEITEQSISWTMVVSPCDMQSLPDKEYIGVNCNRKFHKAILFEQCGSTEILQFQVVHIQELTILIYDTDWLEEILNGMPNLKKLVIINYESGSSSGYSKFADLPVMNKLKTLELVRCEYIILRWFKNAQLDTLKILNSDDKSEQEQEILIEFLAVQKNLTTFALRSVESEGSNLFQSPINDDEIFQFRLKKLSLQAIKLRESLNDYNNLLKFMKIHSKTIEELDLGRQFPDFVYEFVFAKLKNLKTLRLRVNEIPWEADFYDRLEENKSVTKLTLHNGKVSSEFFKRLPNIENLNLLHTSGPELQVISTHLPKLKELSINSFNEIETLQFPALVSLNIQNFFNPADWKTFTQLNSGITSLAIESNTFLDYTDLDNITQNLKKLRTLSIECEIDGDKKFFDVIRKNCKELKTVDINKENLEIRIDQVADIRGLRLREQHLIVVRNSSIDQFWNEKDSHGLFPDDDYNWPEDEINPEDMDPFDLYMMMEDLDYDRDYSDDEYSRESYDIDKDSDFWRRAADN